MKKVKRKRKKNSLKKKSKFPNAVIQNLIILHCKDLLHSYKTKISQYIKKCNTGVDFGTSSLMISQAVE